MSNTKVLRKVAVGSAFMMMAVLNALIFAIIGGIGVLLSLLAVAIGSGDALGLAGGVVGVLFGYLIGIAATALFGGIVGALYALVYNIVAGIAGGLRVVLD